MSFNPYLFFSGNCAEAFTFYAGVFGAEAHIMTMAEVPEDARMPSADPSLVMHAALEINGSALLGSDDPTGDDGPKTGFSVSYNATDAADANSVFDRLAEGGEVTLPVSETFWSPAFGMLKDRFGISWMVGVPTAQA